MTVLLFVQTRSIGVENSLLQIGSLNLPQWRESRRRIYSVCGVCPTLHGVGTGGNTEPKILVRRTRDEQDKTDSRTSDTTVAQNSESCLFL